jgi:hypothetical protein
MNPRHLIGEKVTDNIAVRKTPPADRLDSRGRWSRLLGRVAAFWPETVVLVIALLLWAPRLSGPIDLRWDGGVYYLLGTSLATGHGYRMLSEPGAPEAIQYPPLLPAFVALHAKLLGTARLQIVTPYLRISYAIIFLLYALAVAILARRFLPPVFALLATALCLFYSETVFFSDLLYAELPFALLSVLFVLVASGRSRLSWLREAVGFLLAVNAFLLRTAGGVLLVAWVIDAIITRRWRLVATRFILVLVPILAWQIYVARVRASYEYRHPAYGYQRASYNYNNVSYSENARLVDPFHPERGRLRARTMVMRVISNAPQMMAAVGEAVSTKKRAWVRLCFHVQAHHQILPPRLLTMVPILTLAGLAFAGVLILVRQRASLMVLALLGSMALALITPWPAQFTRYLVPVGSFLTIAVMLAVLRLRHCLDWAKLSHASKVLARSALFAVIFITLAAQLFAIFKMFRERASPEGRMLVSDEQGPHLFSHDTKWQNLERAAQWIGANSRPSAIVATSAPSLLYLLTGRDALIPPLERDTSHARALLDSVPASYVIVDQLDGLDMSRTYALPAVQADPVQWRPVFRAGDTIVYAREEQPNFLGRR